MSFTRPSIARNLSSEASPDVKFLVHYAIATGKDIREFYMETGLIVWLESLEIPVLDKPEEKLKLHKGEPESSRKTGRRKNNFPFLMISYSPSLTYLQSRTAFYRRIILRYAKSSGQAAGRKSVPVQMTIMPSGAAYSCSDSYFLLEAQVFVIQTYMNT